jgi:hypothetical protein
VTRSLAVAIVVAVAGPLVVLIAFGHAGGGDRPRPHPGLLDAQDECVTGDPRFSPRYDPATGRPIPFPACPDLSPADLRSSYRAGWLGVVVALAGAALVLVLAATATLSRRTAYWSLVGVAGVQLLVAGMIALGSTKFELLTLGSEPDPWDAFDRAAKYLALSAVALVPVGVLVHELRRRSRSRLQG